MSFFNKMFASIGIGAAKVDTKLTTEQLQPGELVEGVIEVYGGNVDQKIDEIYLTVFSTYIKEEDDQKYTKKVEIAKIKINEPFIISANEEKVIPFSFTLPLDTPITKGASKVWIHTGLDIKGAIDPQDTDYVDVIPNDLMAAVLNTLKQLGFKLRQVENEAASFRTRRRLPFVQEFEFYPITGMFMGKLDELEVIFFQHRKNEIELMLEIDRRARGLSGLLAEALDLDESLITVTITEQDREKMTEKLAATIQQFC
ncbi:sporulation protein [Aeribacillus alveayuensis]|uniref:Sporulation-control protein n=1 Tax=Aeribacillus alveayuensis TaxID=279215 RepID=A0ABT9VPF1_9BACI|nr:sporulation-control protein [Bacillus alveayuensis]